jgi:hypothetical protein
MRGNNFHLANIVGVALSVQGANNETINGDAIVRPWEQGRQITFLWAGGPFAASSSGRLQFQYQDASDDSWNALTESDGTTQLEFTATDFDDTGAAEDGVLIGTIPLEYVPAAAKALRVNLISEGAQLINGGVAYIISDLHKHPAATADQLFSKVRP